MEKTRERVRRSVRLLEQGHSPVGIFGRGLDWCADSHCYECRHFSRRRSRTLAKVEALSILKTAKKGRTCPCKKTLATNRTHLYRNDRWLAPTEKGFTARPGASSL